MFRFFMVLAGVVILSLSIGNMVAAEVGFAVLGSGVILIGIFLTGEE